MLHCCMSNPLFGEPMDAVFYFSFYIDATDDDDDYTTRHLGFYISNIRKPWSQLEVQLL